jgi:hypothetical protein
MPALPVSGDAIAICLQMCAFYFTARWLALSEGNMLSAAVALGLTTINLVALGFTLWRWFGL